MYATITITTSEQDSNTIQQLRENAEAILTATPMTTKALIIVADQGTKNRPDTTQTVSGDYDSVNIINNESKDLTPHSFGNDDSFGDVSQ